MGRRRWQDRTMSEAVAAQGIERYRALLRVPYARPLFVWALLARMPMGMVPLALILIVRAEGGSYGAAGAVVGSPLRRDRRRRARGRTAHRPARARARAAAARGRLPGALARPLRAGARRRADRGVRCLRGRRGRAHAARSARRSGRSGRRLLADPSLRAAAYALEASLQEVYFVVGPLLVAIVAGLASPVAALALAAARPGSAPPASSRRDPSKRPARATSRSTASSARSRRRACGRSC